MNDDNKVKKEFYKKWWIWVIIVILLMIIAFTAINKLPYLHSTPTTYKGNSEFTKNEKLTLEKYNKITKGMEYEDAIKIIGAEVEPEYEAGKKGTPSHTLTYKYTGIDKVNGDVGSNAIFIFQDGKLTNKAQLGLK